MVKEDIYNFSFSNILSEVARPWTCTMSQWTLVDLVHQPHCCLVVEETETIVVMIDQGAYIPGRLDQDITTNIINNIK